MRKHFIFILTIAFSSAKAFAAAPHHEQLHKLVGQLPQRGYATSIEPLQRLARNPLAQKTIARSIWAIDVISQVPRLNAQQLHNSIHCAANQVTETATASTSFSLHALASLIAQLKIPIRELSQTAYSSEGKGKPANAVATIHGITGRDELVFTQRIGTNGKTYQRSIQRWRINVREKVQGVRRWRGKPIFLMLENNSSEPHVGNFSAWQTHLDLPLTVGVLHQPTGDVQIVFRTLELPVAGPVLPAMTEQPGTGPSLTEDLWQERRAYFASLSAD